MKRSSSFLKGAASILNIRGRSVYFHPYMKGNVVTDLKKDTEALKRDGRVAMLNFKSSW